MSYWQTCTPQTRLLPSITTRSSQTEAGLMLSIQLQALENIPGTPTSVCSSAPTSQEKDSNFTINFQLNNSFKHQANHNHYLQLSTISCFLSLSFISTEFLHSVSKMQDSQYPLLYSFYKIPYVIIFTLLCMRQNLI